MFEAITAAVAKWHTLVKKCTQCSAIFNQAKNVSNEACLSTNCNKIRM